MAINFQLYKLSRYFWAVLGVIGVVMFWAGTWDGLGSLPYLQNPLVSFFVGLLILLVSGLIFKEFDPIGKKDSGKILTAHKIHHHPEKHHIQVKYYDKIKKSHILISATKLKRIEKEAFLVFEHEKKEFFLPIHRVKEILHKNIPWAHKKK
jgi:hypothetical protein